MTKRDEVVTWLRDNGWRYGKAAREFGLPKAQVQQWGREARGLAESEPAPSAALAPARASELVGMTRVAFLEWQLDRALADLDELQGQPKASTAISAMHRTVRELRGDLDDERTRLQRAGELEPDDLSPEELAAMIREEILSAPEVVLEAVEGALEERRNPVRLVR